MFKFFKDKIKGALKNISKTVEEKSDELIQKEITEEPKIAQPIMTREKKIEKIADKKSIAQKIKEKITTRKISNEEFEELFWQLEIVLMENNTAIEVIEKIKESLKLDLVNVPIERNKIEKTIEDNLKATIKELFKDTNFDLISKIKKADKPYVILFLGVNGSGKTTSIAKLTKLLQNNNLKVVLAAADTFRAAAIDQLETWGKELDIKVIKHDYGADAAAVAFDAIKHAKAKKIDVVLIDTAGRMHSNTNLVDELKKVVRVTQPNLKVFVGESITGNDCIEQAKKFDQAVGIDGIILAKADVDEKGGTAISISYVTDKPILYLGTGQKLEDLEKFDVSKIMKGLGW
ncbi:signal recognition particle-docking protein FtsY [Candidatus Woesearchaeota archaeon]|nr:signal recognition particle-docking protein FtsY [Candidatus Woesearchaeota archaeon]